MVKFTNAHKGESKHEIVATGKSGNTLVDFFDEEGKWSPIDISTIETNDLWDLRRSMKRYFDEQLQTIDEELDNWSSIYCAVCGEEDLAYRGQPFVTWGVRGGYILCPRHVRAYDTRFEPKQEILDKVDERREELKDIFG